MAETSDYGGTNEYIPIERLEYDPERDKIVIKEYNPGLEGIGDPWMPAGDYTPPEPQWNNPPSSWDAFTPTSYKGAWDYTGYPAASFLPSAPSLAVLTPNAPAPYTPETPGFTTKAPSWYGGDTQSFISDVLSSYIAPDPVAYPDLWREWVKRHEGEPGAVQSSGWYLGPSGEHLPFRGAAYLPPESAYLPTATARTGVPWGMYYETPGQGLPPPSSNSGFTPTAPSGRSQEEDYALRHPGFAGYSPYNPSRPEWGSPTQTPVQPLTDRSLWAGSYGSSDTLTIPIPTPLVYDARPPFRYTPPDVYPDLRIGSFVLNANTPIFGGLYKSDYDAWHGSADQPPELRALGWFPQFTANSVQNFSEFFNPVRGFAGVANPGPIDLERGLYSSLIDVPATTAAKIIGDIGRGKYSDLPRASKEGLESENQALGTASRGAWEMTPMGQLETSARALWELGQYIKEGKSLPEIWDIYDEKYKALDPLTKVIVDIAIDPLNIPRFGLGAAGKLGREGMGAAKAGNAAEKAFRIVDDLHDFADSVKYVVDQLQELFGIKGGDNSQDKSPSSPVNQLPSKDQMETQYSAMGSAKGTSEFNQGADLEDRFAPPTVAADRRGNSDTFNVQAALNGLVQAGIAPSTVTREMLYRVYIKSGSSLPFDEWLMLLASRPAYLPSVPA